MLNAMKKQTNYFIWQILFVLFLTVLLAICLIDGELGYTMELREAKPVVYFVHHLAEPGRPLEVETYGYTLGETVTCHWKTDSGELETTEDFYIPDERDLEQFITVTVSSDFHEDRTARVYCSRLPVLYLNIENGETIDSRETGKTAEIILQGAGETAAYYYEGTAEVSGRGNTSWEEVKKPYKIKLSEKEGLLGMDKSKKWILLANYNNPSLMRNKLLFDLASDMGVNAPESFWVDLVVNGEYAGNYQLCEQIGFGTTIDLREGILLELDEYYDEEMKFRSSKKQPVMLHEAVGPKQGEEVVFAAEEFVNAFERAIDAPDFSAEYQGRRVRYGDLFDLDSLARYWVVNELFYNCDFMRKSVWFYIDPLQKAYMGPVWDNDWSSGNPPCEDWDRWSSLWFDVEAQKDHWYRSLIKDPVFRKRAREIYWEYRERIGALAGADGDIDRSYWLLYEAALSNDRLWKYGDGYEADVTLLRNWLTNRIEWLDRQFATEKSLAESLLNPQTEQ